MAGDYLPNDLKALWQELATNPVQLTLDDLRKEEGKLRKGIRKRSVLGGGLALIGIVLWAVFFFVLPNVLQRIGSVLTVVGFGYLLIQILMRPARVMPDMGETESIQFYRAELEQQRDFQRGRWLWSRLVIFLPGPVVWMVGLLRAYPEIATYMWCVLATYLVLAIIAVPLNLRLARQYQRRIDALDVSQKG